jgi:tight adherence protein B
MNQMILIIIAGGTVGILLLLVGVIVTVRGERSLVEERLDVYTESELIPGVTEDSSTATPVTDWVNQRVEKSGWGNRISRNLAQADLMLKPAEYLALMLIAAIGVGVVAWYFGGQEIVSGIIGAIIGLILPGIYIRRQKSRRLNRFNEQLQDMLNLVVNGLRAGFSTVQALEAVSRELPDPISSEFRRVVQEMQLGLSMEDALDNLLRRIPSSDLDFIIVAMNVQREVGGNLAEILDTISYTIRERVRIKGEIRVLTSQVIYSGRFISMLPLIVSLILWFINRDYMMTFFDNLICGIIMLSCAAILIGVGYFMMTRIANIEV